MPFSPRGKRLRDLILPPRGNPEVSGGKAAEITKLIKSNIFTNYQFNPFLFPDAKIAKFSIIKSPCQAVSEHPDIHWVRGDHKEIVTC